MGNFRRAGQNYEVNGMRPESNTFLVDGMRDINRMDGGYAYRPPADAMAEFRILTRPHRLSSVEPAAALPLSSPVQAPISFTERCMSSCANDALDANNYFAPRKEELKQNQFGGTIGGPMVHNHAYFFTYYEGLRENQDITHGVVVPTVAERSGDFSADTPILLNSTRTPFGNNLSGQINAITAKIPEVLSHSNTPENPHLAQTTNLSQYNSDQAGKGRLVAAELGCFKRALQLLDDGTPKPIFGTRRRCSRVSRWLLRQHTPGRID